MEPYSVYVKTNESGYIIAVNSSAFLQDIDGWTEIDRGLGDEYHHAQGNYFPESILTDSGAYRYKLADGKAVACTPEEIRQQEEENASPPAPTLENRVESLETDSAETREAMEMLLSGVTE